MDEREKQCAKKREENITSSNKNFKLQKAKHRSKKKNMIQQNDGNNGTTTGITKRKITLNRKGKETTQLHRYDRHIFTILFTWWWCCDHKH